MKKLSWSIAMLFFVMSVLPASALAWGPAGHRIIAQIAQDNLSPAARSQVSRILKGASMSSVATWADIVRNTGRPETAGWHFVDIPLKADSYDAERDCPKDDCIVAKIDDFRAALANSSSTTQRAEALKFLIHFVGDIFDPMHCVDNHDRGGNSVRVTFFGKITTLRRDYGRAVASSTTTWGWPVMPSEIKPGSAAFTAR